MSFLNTPLGLWILSSIFVSFGSWSYTLWSKSLEESKIKGVQIRRLDQEIEHRLWVGVLENFKGAFEERDLESIKRFGADLPKRVMLKPLENDVLFPENANRTLYSLLFELDYLVAEDQKPCLRKAQEQAEGLRRRWLTAAPSTLKELEEFSLHIELLQLRRWRRLPAQDYQKDMQKGEGAARGRWESCRESRIQARLKEFYKTRVAEFWSIDEYVSPGRLDEMARLATRRKEVDGQTVIALSGWIWYVAGVISALVGARIAFRRKIALAE